MTDWEVELFDALVEASQELGRARLAFGLTDSRRQYCLNAQVEARAVLGKYEAAREAYELSLSRMPRPKEPTE